MERSLSSQRFLTIGMSTSIFICASAVVLCLFPEIPFQVEGRYPKSLIGKNFCAYLLELRNSSTSFKGIRKALIDTLLDGYESARYGTGVSAGGALLALFSAMLPGLRSRHNFSWVFHGLFCLCPGLWEN